MNIKITADKGITPREIDILIAEEKELYRTQGKKLAEINFTLEKDEIVIKSYACSPIRRIRRITGYLSEEHNFNAAKQAELHNRVNHFCPQCG